MHRNFHHGTAHTWSPAIDLREDETRYVLEAEIPGLNKKDIQLSLEESMLTISGKKSESQETKKSLKSYCQERAYGEFSRQIRLNDAVDSDNVQAHYKNGILTVVLQKSKKSQLKEIPVKLK